MKPVKQKVTYWFLFIPVWSVTRSVDEDALYERMKERFGGEMEAALDKALSGKQ